jgi:hypothetical protein
LAAEQTCEPQSESAVHIGQPVAFVVWRDATPSVHAVMHASRALSPSPQQVPEGPYAARLVGSSDGSIEPTQVR